LQHPSDWEEIEPSSAEIQLIGSVPYIIKFQLPSSLEDDLSTRSVRPEVTVDAEEEVNSPLEQYVSQQIDKVASFASDVTTAEITLSNSPAIRVDSIFPGGNLHRMSVYTLADNGIVYNVEYSAHVAQFDTYLPVAQQIIDSFRITDSDQTTNNEVENDDNSEDNDDDDNIVNQ
jgi:hypothetical protein